MDSVAVPAQGRRQKCRRRLGWRALSRLLRPAEQGSGEKWGRGPRVHTLGKHCGAAERLKAGSPRDRRVRFVAPGPGSKTEDMNAMASVADAPALGIQCCCLGCRPGLRQRAEGGEMVAGSRPSNRHAGLERVDHAPELVDFAALNHFQGLEPAEC